MRYEETRKDNGTATITPDRVKAGTKCSFIIKYTAGPAGIKKGGSILVQIPYGFTQPTLIKGTEPGFCRVRSDNPKVELELFVRDPAGEGKYNINIRWGRNLFIYVKEGNLNEGDTVYLLYGGRDTSLEVERFNSITVPYFSMEHEFTVGTDHNGKREAKNSGFALIEEQPFVTVEPCEPSLIRVVIPSTAKPQEKITVKYAVVDKLRNVAGNTDQNVKISKVNGNTLSSIKKVHNPTGSLKSSTIEGYGIKRFKAETEKAAGLSNPCIVSDTDLNIYWGDIHGHTELSDGLGSARDYYRYAKDCAMLDFSAITDHDFQISDEDWDVIQQETSNFYKPGEFVTLLGYEINHKKVFGDKNIYYPGDRAPLIRGKKCGEYKPEYNDFYENVKQWKKYGAMMILHQHYRGLESFYDPNIVRLGEIYSVWGASEYYGNDLPIRPSLTMDFSKNTLQHGLSMDYRIGFIGSSDCHMGHPGYTNWLRTMKAYNGGLAAVLAKNLTREDIFNALWNRKCYATTGKRIYMDFKINGELMGSEIRISEKTVIEANVVGTCDLEYVKVIKNNKDWYIYNCDGRQAHFEIFDEPQGGNCYYIRVKQKDGNMAWSSPIWAD